MKILEQSVSRFQKSSKKSSPRRRQSLSIGSASDVSLTGYSADDRPDRGAGRFLNAADPGGEYKILHFNKLNETGRAPAFSFRSANEAMAHGRLERDHVFQNPYNTAGGTSMAFS